MTVKICIMSQKISITNKCCTTFHKKFFFEQQSQHIRISEGSCDILKYIKIEYQIFKKIIIYHNIPV